MTCTVEVRPEDEVRIVVTPFSIIIVKLSIIIVKRGKEDHETGIYFDIPAVQPQPKDSKVANPISIFGQILGILV
ncbi:MAG TPA: hypothetical protein VI685_18155, partial [Candidatus Angelobacter sp.]